MRERVTIVENIAISSVQSICFFERRPSSKIAVRAFKPILRIWLATPDGCSTNALTQFALKKVRILRQRKAAAGAENIGDDFSHGHDTQPATNLRRVF
jgi:hypothetical protein